MGSRGQHIPRAAWPTARAAGVCSALAVLLAALAVCLACVTPGTGDPGAASTTAVSATAVTADSTTHHGPAVAHPVDCPSDEVCCGAAADGARAVLVAPVHPLPTVLPRMPAVPRAPDASPCTLLPGHTARAPDLHVLQVQRT